MPAWSEGLEDMGQGARSEEDTFLGLHLLAKLGNFPGPPLRAAACREPGSARQREGCRGEQGCSEAGSPGGSTRGNRNPLRAASR